MCTMRRRRGRYGDKFLNRAALVRAAFGPDFHPVVEVSHVLVIRIQPDETAAPIVSSSLEPL